MMKGKGLKKFFLYLLIFIDNINHNLTKLTFYSSAAIVTNDETDRNQFPRSKGSQE